MVRESVLYDILESKKDRIKELEATLNNIEKEKSKKTKLSKDDIALVERSENELTNVSIQCVSPMIKLSKYGYADFEEKPDGHFEIKLEHSSQPIFRTVYSKLKKRVPKTFAEQIEKIEKELSQELTSYIKQQFIKQLSLSIAPPSKGHILEIPYESLEKLTESTITLLQLVVAAKNQPFSFSLSPQDTKNIPLKNITDLADFAQGRLSRTIFNAVNKYQSETGYPSYDIFEAQSENILLENDDFKKQLHAKSLQGFLSQYLLPSQDQDKAWKANVLAKFLASEENENEKTKTLDKMLEAERYRQYALIFNSLDKIQKLTTELKNKLTGLSIPASIFTTGKDQPVTIIEAILCKDIEIKAGKLELEIAKNISWSTCDIRTKEIQEAVNKLGANWEKNLTDLSDALKISNDNKLVIVYRIGKEEKIAGPFNNSVNVKLAKTNNVAFTPPAIETKKPIYSTKKILRRPVQ